jgi:hypothetical protein
MSAGLHDADITRLRGLNPYWRLALNQAWGANSLMVGGSGMVSRIYDDPLNTGDPATIHHFNDVGVDAQYQYLLDPHAVTAQLVVTRQRHRYPDMLANLGVDFVDASGNSLAPTNSSDTMRLIRARLSYVWQARYGGSASVFSLTGTTNTANQSSGFDPATLTITADPAASVASTRVGGNLSGNPATRGSTLELFWTPIQYLRVGGQFTAYSRYNGAARNYDGFGRNASDNNSLFLYVWAAY